LGVSGQILSYFSIVFHYFDQFVDDHNEVSFNETLEKQFDALTSSNSMTEILIKKMVLE